MSWSPDAQKLLTELMAQQIITADEWQQVIALLSDNANLYSALRLSGVDDKVWTHLAGEYGRTLYGRRGDLQVIFADLFDHRAALATGLLPHRTRGVETEVLSFEPRFTRVPHPALDPLTLRVGLVTPGLWRTLFHLTFPPVLTGRLSLAEATALVTHTLTGQHTGATPEQLAEIQALTLGYEFIDPLTHPPDDAVQHMVNLDTKAHIGCYPHHREGDVLVVLMARPDNAAALRQVSEQAQLKVRAAISTQRAIDALIRAEDLGHVMGAGPEDHEVSGPLVAVS